MKAIIAKRVGMFELFFDLVFGYAISKIAVMIHHPVNGVLPAVNYFQFLLVVVVVMQVWLYQVLYFNRYGKDRLGDIAGLIVEMFVMVYLSNNINTDWHITFEYFNIAMAVMIVDLLLQYALGNSKDKQSDHRVFIYTLAIELALIIAGLFLGYDVGVYFAIVGYLVGFLLPIVLYKKFNAANINFPHLVERVSLIIIIAFGEAVVNIASYFTKNIPLHLPILVFASLVLMFATYVIEVDNFIEEKQYNKGFILMYSHVALVATILSITVGFVYLNMNHVNKTFVALFLAVAEAIYYLFILTLSVYNKAKFQLNMINILTTCVCLIAGIILFYLLRNSQTGLLIVLLVLNVIIFGQYYLKKKQRSN